MATSETKSSQADPKRRCWECLRRRLVCDCTRPSCRKCLISGIECPGYGEKKPLTWLAPGKVLARPRIAKSASKAAVLDSKLCAVPECSKTISVFDSDSASASAPASLSPSRKNLSFSPKNCSLYLEAIGIQGDLSIRERWGKILEWLWSQAGRTVVKITVPRGFLTTDTCDMVQAASYHNSVILPTWVSSQLETSPFLLPVDCLHHYPTTVIYAMVAMTLTHWMITRAQAGSQQCIQRILYHRGNAIRSLNEDISNEERRCNNLTLSSVLVMMYCDLQQNIWGDWRFHFDAAIRIIDMRGGPLTLANESPQMKIPLFFLAIIDIMSLTTSPSATNLVSISKPEMENFIMGLYDIGLYPNFPCPRSLFLYILKTTHLRARYAQFLNLTLIEKKAMMKEAQGLLTLVVAFSPSSWALLDAEKESDRKLIATIFQSAVLVYILLSLAPLFACSDTPEPPFDTISPLLLSTQSPNSLRELHSVRLLSHLKTARSINKAKSVVFWPLIVAGVDAATANLDTKIFIENMMDELVKEQGIALPVVAKAALRKFWMKGGRETGKWEWDVCWDKRYAFVI